jgi:hypothetical protein
MSRAEKVKPVYTSLTDTQINALKDIAFIQGISLFKLIRQIIIEYLHKS